MELSVEEILDLETSVWETLRTANLDLDAEMLATDFLGVYPTGLATKTEHCEALRNGPTIARYSLENPRLIALGKDCVLLSYFAIFNRINEGREQPTEQMFVSSIWRKFGNQWLNTFSQDTPVAS